MDINTLNTVIDKLETEADHCKYMLTWALKQTDSETRERDTAMWSTCLVQAKRSLEIVDEMLVGEAA